jgi:hypothetical protein
MMYFEHWHGLALRLQGGRAWLLLGLWGSASVEKWIAAMQRERGSVVRRYIRWPFVVLVK